MSLRLVVVGLILTTMLALGMIAWRITAPPVRVVAHSTAPVKPLTEKYLVAAHTLPAGTLVRAADVTLRDAAVDKLPQGAVLDTQFNRAAMIGALVRTYISAGSPILEANVLRPRDRGFLAAVLPPGMQAVSIPVDQVSGVAGLIWPGDHVDVLLTQIFSSNGKEQIAPGHRVMTQTVLTNVRVIAVDQAMVQGASTADAAAGKIAHTVTLEVSPRDAERLNVAQNLGRLTLAIRAVAQSKVPQPELRTPMFAGEVSPILAATGAPTGSGHVVEVIEGNTRTKVQFP